MLENIPSSMSLEENNALMQKVAKNQIQKVLCDPTSNKTSGQMASLYIFIGNFETPLGLISLEWCNIYKIIFKQEGLQTLLHGAHP